MPAFAALVARHRSWVLVAAALLGLVAAGGLAPAPAPAPRDEAVFNVADLVPTVIPAALAAPAVTIRIAANATGQPKAPDMPASPAKPDTPAAADPIDVPAAPAAKGHKKGATVGITIDDESGRVRVAGADGSREFDSFEAFVQQAPWIAGLVFVVVFSCS